MKEWWYRFELFNRNIMQILYMILSFLVAIFKKETGRINFNNKLLNISEVLFLHVVNIKIINEMYTF